MELGFSDEARQELKDLIKEALGEFFREAQEELEEKAFISTMQVPDALEVIAEIPMRQLLDELEVEERDRRDEGRPGILAAITVRRRELATAD